MSLRTLIFFGLMSLSLGLILPEQNSPSANDGAVSDWVYGDVVPVSEDVVLVRKARSPQGSLSGNFEHGGQEGSRANIDYNQRFGRNKKWNVYAGVSRNFRYNDNSARVGFRYNF